MEMEQRMERAKAMAEFTNEKQDGDLTLQTGFWLGMSASADREYDINKNLELESHFLRKEPEKLSNGCHFTEKFSDCAIDYRKKYHQNYNRDEKPEDDSNGTNRRTLSITPPNNDDRKPCQIEKNSDDESPFKKCEISVQNETVIASRLDGVVLLSGRGTTLYKCHLCKNGGRICSSFGRLQRHLAMHCRTKRASEDDPYSRRVDGSNCDSEGVRFCSETKNGDAIAAPTSRVDISHSEVPSSTSVLADLSFERNVSKNLVGLDIKMENVKSQLDGLESFANGEIYRKSDAYGENASMPSSSSTDAHALFHGRQYLQARRRRMRRLRNAQSDPGVRRSSQRLSVVTSEMLETFDRESKDNNNCDTGTSVPTVFNWNASRARRRHSRRQSAIANLSQPSAQSSGHAKEGTVDRIQSSVGVDLTTVGHESVWPVVEPGSSKTKSDFEMAAQFPMNVEPLYASSPKHVFSPDHIRSPNNTQNYCSASNLDGHQMVVSHSSAQVALSAAGSETSSQVSGSGSSISLPFTPLAFSPNMIQGLNALMGSPQILSSLLSLPGGLLSNPLSYYAHLSSSLLAINSSSALPSQSSARDVFVKQEINPMDCSPEVAGRCSARDASSNANTEWSTPLAGSTNDAYSNTKCSSLSRTHSRLDVVRRPIKREDSCKSVMMADGRTVYRCMYCKKDFCTMSDVNRHMDFHEDIRPYKCRFCSYFARTNSQLKVHMMRHQGIREFLCHLCCYKGVTQSDLNRHTKSQIHRMKERNECRQCREGFISAVNLEQHYREAHGFASQLPDSVT